MIDIPRQPPTLLRLTGAAVVAAAGEGRQGRVGAVRRRSLPVPVPGAKFNRKDLSLRLA